MIHFTVVDLDQAGQPVIESCEWATVPRVGDRLGRIAPSGLGMEYRYVRHVTWRTDAAKPPAILVEVSATDPLNRPA